MDLGIRDRAAVVTAASRGMGRAIAEALAAEGCRLAICSRDPDAIAGTAQEIRQAHGAEVFHAAVDVSDLAALEAFLGAARERLGPVSIAVAIPAARRAGVSRTSAPRTGKLPSG